MTRAGASRTTTSVILGAALLAIPVLAALVSLVWTPYNPIPVTTADRMLPPGGGHLLGTDSFGRDILSLLMYGARITLTVGFAAVALAVVVGIPVGVLAGMRGGRVDQLLMRFTDVLLAFPALLLMIVFGAAFGSSTTSATLAVGIAAAPAFARLSRAGTLQVMSRDYITAARSANRGALFIARRHVLPNIASLIVVQAAVAFSMAVLSEAALSYLGFGTAPPTPSWGRMLQEGQTYLYSNPLLVLWPGLAIALTVLALNLLADGLRDRFDPRSTSPTRTPSSSPTAAKR
jgi:peptide/nickel transport system permease protein